LKERAPLNQLLNENSRYQDSMKHLKFLLIFSLMVLDFGTVSAQKVKLIFGHLSELKGIKSYDIKFQYDSIMVGYGTSEKEYLSKKKTDWEAKEEGKGARFVAMWFDDRKKLYEPAFIKSIEEVGEFKTGDKNAHYTILLKSQSLEGGWDVGVIDRAGDINGELWIVESADESRVIAKILFDQMVGTYKSAGDFDITHRIASAYSKAGKSLGFYLRKATK
jgi:hypothetical protein